MGEIHELFVVALSLVWFAGVTPEFRLGFGSVWLRFSSISGPFRVRFGVLGGVGVGVGERGFCKGKEYHYTRPRTLVLLDRSTTHLDTLLSAGFDLEMPRRGRSQGDVVQKGVITKGVVSLEESLESLNSLNSLESLEYGRILLYFPKSGDSLKSLESLNSLESLANGRF